MLCLIVGVYWASWGLRCLVFSSVEVSKRIPTEVSWVGICFVTIVVLACGCYETTTNHSNHYHEPIAPMTMNLINYESPPSTCPPNSKWLPETILDHLKLVIIQRHKPQHILYIYNIDKTQATMTHYHQSLQSFTVSTSTNSFHCHYNLGVLTTVNHGACPNSHIATS